MVNGLLVKSFPDIVSTDFTAQMEERLDEVEEGTQDWVGLLRDFYGPFKIDLEKAKIEMRDVKREETPTDTSARSAARPWSSSGAATATSWPARATPSAATPRSSPAAADGSIRW